MKLKNIFLPILSAIIIFTGLFACRQNNSAETSLPDSLKKQTLSLDTFSNFPEVNNCSCFFSADSTAYQKQTYLLAYDLATTAFMKINGVMIKFTQTEYAVVDKSSVTKFKSDEYELLLETGDVRELNTTSTVQSGSIRVTNMDGVVVIIPFYGQCGCKKPS
jgi:hypothetical protein